MILGLRTAIYPVTDLAAGKAFYSAVLGVAPYFDEPYYVGYSVGGFELGLIPDETPHADGCEALWGVADADASYAQLLAIGATPLVPVKDVGGGIRVADVLDPFGNRFSIIENPHFDAKAAR